MTEVTITELWDPDALADVPAPPAKPVEDRREKLAAALKLIDRFRADGVIP